MILLLALACAPKEPTPWWLQEDTSAPEPESPYFEPSAAFEDGVFGAIESRTWRGFYARVFLP